MGSMTQLLRGAAERIGKMDIVKGLGKEQERKITGGDIGISIGSGGPGMPFPPAPIDPVPELHHPENPGQAEPFKEIVPETNP